ncbi:MAG TPA: UDP-3-O-(3-hydroxymyristoyl)glucosamine N-acyltransferase [Edaphocola sp.]|nr:UDP-3-O-(3-hydroxymyristoyl)glucosamine N-acyltransferase [Edaphocola sp.]
MVFTAGQIAAMIKGRVEGDSAQTISTIAKIEEAGKGALVFIANPKYEQYLTQTKASVILLSEAIKVPETVSATLIRVPDPYAAFAQLMDAYQQIIAPKARSGIEQPSFIAPSATIGKDVYVGAFAYIGEHVRIGDGAQIYPGTYLGDHVSVGAKTTLHPGVKIYAHCRVGNEVIIHAGAVIGADGFGFAPQPDGTFKKVPQLGHVIIEDQVEIGANTTIDRATMGATRIGKNVKIDNLVQIAHNVNIDHNTAIAAQAGISGSTKIGRNCIIGGQAGVVGHIQLADGTRVNAQSGVTKTVKKANTDLSGSPAFGYKAALKSQVIFKDLPGLLTRIQLLEEKLAGLNHSENELKS